MYNLLLSEWCIEKSLLNIKSLKNALKKDKVIKVVICCWDQNNNDKRKKKWG